MSQFYNDATPALCLIYFDIIVPTVSIISLTIMLPAIYKYIKSQDVKQKCLYWSGLIFFITIVLSAITMMLYSIYFCRDFNTFTILFNIASLFFVTQSLQLLGILFARVYYVFDGTMFALSTVTVRLWCISYSVMVVMAISAAIATANFRRTIIGSIIIVSAFITLIITIIFLISLFLYKMTQVYKCMNKENNDSKFLKIITKTVILTIISISATLLNGIGTAGVASTKSIHLAMVARFLVLFDLSSNFWCVILGYCGYKDWYLKLCGCCDSKCTACWHKIVRPESHVLKEISEANETVTAESGRQVI